MRHVGRGLTHSLRILSWTCESTARRDVEEQSSVGERRCSHVHLGAFTSWQSALETRPVNASPGSRPAFLPPDAPTGFLAAISRMLQDYPKKVRKIQNSSLKS